VSLSLRPTDASSFVDIVAWVDTAFDGELVAPREIIERLGLTQSAAVSALLADGTTAVLETFHCQIAWIDGEREIEVIANNGRLPLLGIGLLRGRRLTIDYESGSLSIE
jgi:clan AA aspartic protease